ncbi:hypothetical protein RXV86_01930 [Alisedimentitalea sp. MJ-SS2]|uniref:hypothetical protein n=1 Tax=Aliisedimentitalea sp. MJ-SS2 TaxID=3049795 RepID=UPI002908A8C1|nr:hypothetical protein [Alisedimentitalea sp. MJ-SS2]MDU8926135.1 hypothetical protein [Alisedimentitalea sp. MJ-SS2]
MRRFLSVAFVTLLIVPMPAISGDGGGIGLKARLQILTEDDFQENVVGHEATHRSGDSFIAYRNGKLTGTVDGAKLTATWYWQGKTWCNKGNAGSLRISACYRLELDGNRLHRKPAKGGNTMTYRMKF